MREDEEDCPFEMTEEDIIKYKEIFIDSLKTEIEWDIY